MLQEILQVSTELRKRKVLRAAGSYLMASWILLEASSVVLPALGVHDRVLTVLVILAFVGFPVAVIVGWCFDLTEDGLIRAKPFWVDRPEPIPGRRIPWFSGLGYMAGLVGVSVAVWAVHFRAPGPITTVGDEPLTQLAAVGAAPPPVPTSFLPPDTLALLESGQTERLMALGEGALADPEREAVGHLLVGHGYAVRGEREEALAHYGQALAADPTLHTAPGLVPQLVGALGWRTAAARALLLEYPSEKAIEALATRATEGGPLGRKAAIWILEDLGQEDRVDPVSRGLADLAEAKTCEEKRAAVELLGAHPDRRALAPLKKLRRGGVARWFQNRCLRDPLKKAIAAVEASPPQS